MWRLPPAASTAAPPPATHYNATAAAISPCFDNDDLTSSPPFDGESVTVPWQLAAAAAVRFRVQRNDQEDNIGPTCIPLFSSLQYFCSQ